MKDQTPKIKTCLNCREEIMGRADKKFCSDYCRNQYNNSLNSDANKYVRNINYILRKNRRILSGLNPEGKITVHKNKIYEKGYNFNYFTNIYTTKTGKTYFFCYEQGYLEIENDLLMLVKKQDYVE